jgi:hypothetical protein
MEPTMPENPNQSKLTLDSKYVSAGLAAIGVVALAAAGFVNITTPGEEECREELTDVKVEAASCNTRVELLSEAKDACKDALKAVTSENP